ncbi:putative membrane protein DUF2339 [Cricetibacter osteomyelitidis]|uniref:Putative membrane protein DUF2339 n=1 Tax=Cricetibacter osteomyelitidis TaxID=1521931 RepID=A0A4R2T3M6_9PAST|nr:DUF2339 domain-containing protein [Cricetibacter osteomyelitidis]TCP96870.1 putative membrane protein DUF2339 [Cricetibacter osteomyelitidis]
MIIVLYLLICLGSTIVGLFNGSAEGGLIMGLVFCGVIALMRSSFKDNAHENHQSAHTQKNDNTSQKEVLHELGKRISMLERQVFLLNEQINHLRTRDEIYQFYHTDESFSQSNIAENEQIQTTEIPQKSTALDDVAITNETQAEISAIKVFSSNAADLDNKITDCEAMDKTAETVDEIMAEMADTAISEQQIESVQIAESTAVGQSQIAPWTQSEQEQPKPQKESAPNPIWQWLVSGNPMLKVGAVILFLGLGFLLRFASEHFTFPIESRYISVAVAGAVCGVIGWYLRHRRREYGLTLQGLGIAVLYLTALGALKLHTLLPQSVVFGIQVGLVVVMAVLAVLQDARILAQVALLGGLASPILVSDGSGNYLALFSYLSLLNCGVAAMAWFKSWRSLNLIGAIGTLLISGTWGMKYYNPELFCVCETFLVFHLVLYSIVVWRFAHRQALALQNQPQPVDVNNAPISEIFSNWLKSIGRISVLDSSLLFGVAFSAFVYQIAMTDHWTNGAMWSALGFAVFYGLLGTLVRHSKVDIRIVSDAMFALALILGTSALVFLDTQNSNWKATFLCLEAALVYGFSIRQRLPASRTFAALLFVLSWLKHFINFDFSMTTAFIVLVSGFAFAVLWQSYRRSESAQWEKFAVGVVLALTLIQAAAIPLRLEMLDILQMPIALWLIALQSLLIYAAAIKFKLPKFRAFAMIEFALAWLFHFDQFNFPIHTALLMIPTGALIPWLWQRYCKDSLNWEKSAAGAVLAATLFLTTVLPWRLYNLAIWSDEATIIVSALLGLAYGFAQYHRENRVFAVASAVVFALFAVLRYPSEYSALSLKISAIVVAVVALATSWTLHKVRWKPAKLPKLQNILGWIVLICALLQLYYVFISFEWVEEVSALVLSFAVILYWAWQVRWLQASLLTLAFMPLFVAATFYENVHQYFYEPQLLRSLISGFCALALHFAIMKELRLRIKKTLRIIWHNVGFNVFVLSFTLLSIRWENKWENVAEIWLFSVMTIVPLVAFILVVKFAKQLKQHKLSSLVDIGILPTIVCLIIWSLMTFSADGIVPNFPYIPVLNPYELLSLLFAFVLWKWLHICGWSLHKAMVYIGYAVFGFLLLNIMVLRMWHYYDDIPWRLTELLASISLQSTLSIVWATAAITLMMFGHKRQERLNWLIGAGLMGVVVVKLFLVELGNSGSIARIVSFIAVGVLLLLVGYFAPVPPKNQVISGD